MGEKVAGSVWAAVWGNPGAGGTGTDRGGNNAKTNTVRLLASADWNRVFISFSGCLDLRHSSKILARGSPKRTVFCKPLIHKQKDRGRYVAAYPKGLQYYGSKGDIHPCLHESEHGGV